MTITAIKTGDMPRKCVASKFVLKTAVIKVGEAIAATFITSSEISHFFRGRSSP